MSSLNADHQEENSLLQLLNSRASLSWLNHLKPDPETDKHRPNKSSRQVKGGHYVKVAPTTLPNPYLVAYSAALMKDMGLDPNQVAEGEDREKEESSGKSQRALFASFFAGNTKLMPAFHGNSWATPYALSIYGGEMMDNCPFKNGNGYGDGRAISLAEVVVPAAAVATVFEGRGEVRRDLVGEGRQRGEEGARWELQVKGAGTTPFCRGGDGRAVLRSSVRKFLASEAMHSMGVPTTRSLCLIASHSERSKRPWYSSNHQSSRVAVPTSVDDQRLAHIPREMRQQAIAYFKHQVQGPDTMITEPVAAVCRVAPSFLRIGHVELHFRRWRRARRGSAEQSTCLEGLRLIAEHAVYREFPALLPLLKETEKGEAGEGGARGAFRQMLVKSGQAIGRLTAEWMRVGYVQGNFNSDNCLVGGRTMDYGPFGFMQKMERSWNMWSGGGEHFSFLNQPKAGTKNFQSLCTAVAPLLCTDPADPAQMVAAEEQVKALVQQQQAYALKCSKQMWLRKLGMASWSLPSLASNGGDGGDDWQLQGEEDGLLALLEDVQADFTLFFRRLSELPPHFLTEQAAKPAEEGGKGEGMGRVRRRLQAASQAALLAPLGGCFYVPLSDSHKHRMAKWLRNWLLHVHCNPAALVASAAAAAPTSPSSGPAIQSSLGLLTQDLMNRVNPKFVPREWMLKQAYEAAGEGDHSVLEELQAVLSRPYEEQSEVVSGKYFRLAPDETYSGAGQAGTAFMS